MPDFRTDLAAEMRDHAMREYARKNMGEPDGVIYREEKITETIGKSTIEITSDEGAAAIGKEKGKYVTFTFPEPENMDAEIFGALYRALADSLRELCFSAKPGAKSVLVCGLGSRNITADSLGPAAADGVLATHHIKAANEKVFAEIGFFDTAVLTPGVSAQTGMESAELIMAAAKKLCPDMIIAIDALCARDAARLCKTVQLCTAGISPGAGIGNFRAGLNEKSLGVPIVGVGVPTVIEGRTLVLDALGDGADKSEKEKAGERLAGLFVSPKNIDRSVEILSRALSYAVNTAFQEGLSAEEIALM